MANRVTPDSEFLKEELYNILSVGKENAVNQSYIKSKLGIEYRIIRYLVNELRQDGYPICSTSYDGYWIARNEEELNYCISHLRAHIKTLVSTVHALDKCKQNL